jgi:hypothetical protein
MTGKLALLAAPALLLTARAFAWEGPDCTLVVWSDAHAHYHCADEAPYREVRYHDPRPLSVPRVYVDLSFVRYAPGWRRHGHHWGWYPAPHAFLPPCHHGHHCRRWARWH